MSSPDEDEALLELLADTDETWAPLRVEDRRAGQWAVRQEYAAGGVAWGGFDTSTAAGQRSRRLLAQMERAGLVTVTRGGKGKPVRVKLTEKGFARSRKLAGVPGLAESREFLGEVEALWATLRPKWVHDCEAGHLAPEEKLVEALGLDAGGVEMLALPSLEKGWLTSASTIRGDVLYFVSEAGQAELGTAPKKKRTARE
jgi:DNA-binding PadR family transcriptional regulator